MRDHSKNRLALITGRYAARQQEKAAGDRRAFDDAFRAVRGEVILPVLGEIAAELRSAGHAPRIALDEAPETPSVALALGIRGVTAAPGTDLIAFSVIQRREAPEILAYLVVKPPPMDLLRFASPADITAYQVEQLVVDAIEHIFACRSI
ncbi:hypothetical protein SOCEGT47_032060 [Sorangium cellulosum]|uniref:Uncharacterized protein n=1 Tax=Sorangium cellulosum TaxID=56 RepID=A0A4P2Q0L5_SORCE|nr:hypothetical protein [Sorangium cellulosum]AUX22700.1 hypothetical protein SOCEGT47_032060 [Sorangium cellulosum]